MLHVTVGEVRKCWKQTESTPWCRCWFHYTLHVYG